MYENVLERYIITFELFYDFNVWERIPKDQPRTFEENPYNLMQHCLVVYIDGTDDGPSVDRRGIQANVIPHLEIFEKALFT